MAHRRALRRVAPVRAQRAASRALRRRMVGLAWTTKPEQAAGEVRRQPVPDHPSHTLARRGADGVRSGHRPAGGIRRVTVLFRPGARGRTRRPASAAVGPLSARRSVVPPALLNLAAEDGVLAAAAVACASTAKVSPLPEAHGALAVATAVEAATAGTSPRPGAVQVDGVLAAVRPPVTRRPREAQRLTTPQLPPVEALRVRALQRPQGLVAAAVGLIVAGATLRDADCNDRGFAAGSHRARAGEPPGFPVSRFPSTPWHGLDRAGAYFCGQETGTAAGSVRLSGWGWIRKMAPPPVLPENGDLNPIATNPRFGIAHLIPGKRET
jgi:hypothetical protein